MRYIVNSTDTQGMTPTYDASQQVKKPLDNYDVSVSTNRARRPDVKHIPHWANIILFLHLYGKFPPKLNSKQLQRENETWIKYKHLLRPGSTASKHLFSLHPVLFHHYDKHVERQLFHPAMLANYRGSNGLEETFRET